MNIRKFSLIQAKVKKGLPVTKKEIDTLETELRECEVSLWKSFMDAGYQYDQTKQAYVAPARKEA